MTRIIIIDPNKKTVEERELSPARDAHAYQIREIIGDDFFDDTFKVTKDGIENIIHTSEEAYFGDSAAFVLSGWSLDPYMGICVLSGTDKRGNTISTNVTVKEILERIIFLDSRKN